MNRVALIRKAGAAAAGGLWALAQPAVVRADGLVGNLPTQGGHLTKNDVTNVMVQVIQWGLMFASAIGAIAIVVNGYQYIMSAGNPEKIERAKQGLTWSIGGFVLAISSYAIVYAVANALGFTQLNTLQNHQPPSLTKGAPAILIALANTLFMFAGAVAVVFLILGGYRYMTSQGNQELVEKAKKTIMYALVGLILVFASASIFNLITTQLHVG